MIGSLPSAGDLEGTVAAVIDTTPEIADDKRHCTYSEVHLSDVTVHPPSWYSSAEKATWQKAVVSCWQKVEALRVKVGDRVSFTNCDEVGAYHRFSRDAMWFENGTKGTIHVHNNC